MTTELTISLEDDEVRRIKNAVSKRTNKVRQKRAELFSSDPRGRDVEDLSNPVKTEDVDIRQAVNKILQHGLKEVEEK